eukprot:scpid71956/ scgid30347/ 
MGVTNMLTASDQQHSSSSLESLISSPLDTAVSWNSPTLDSMPTPPMQINAARTQAGELSRGLTGFSDVFFKPLSASSITLPAAPPMANQDRTLPNGNLLNSFNDSTARSDAVPSANIATATTACSDMTDLDQFRLFSPASYTSSIGCCGFTDIGLGAMLNLSSMDGRGGTTCDTSFLASSNGSPGLTSQPSVFASESQVSIGPVSLPSLSLSAGTPPALSHGGMHCTAPVQHVTSPVRVPCRSHTGPSPLVTNITSRPTTLLNRTLQAITPQQSTIPTPMPLGVHTANAPSQRSAAQETEMTLALPAPNTSDQQYDDLWSVAETLVSLSGTAAAAAAAPSGMQQVNKHDECDCIICKPDSENFLAVPDLWSPSPKEEKAKKAKGKKQKVKSSPTQENKGSSRFQPYRHQDGHGAASRCLTTPPSPLANATGGWPCSIARSRVLPVGVHTASPSLVARVRETGTDHGDLTDVTKAWTPAGHADTGGSVRGRVTTCAMPSVAESPSDQPESALPLDVAKWSEQDVAQWLQFHHLLQQFDTVDRKILGLTSFNVTGVELCQWSKAEFMSHIAVAGSALHEEIQFRMESMKREAAGKLEG